MNDPIYSLLPIVLIVVLILAFARRASDTRTEPCVRSKSRPVPKPVKTSISGPAYIIDGDSLRIKGTDIRLFGVDAPEMNHPFGNQAKWALFGLCKGLSVRADIVNTDDYSRTVARCYLPDGRDLSAEMVKCGFAIDWPKFSGGAYRDLEVANARRKMWLADARQNGRMHVWQEFEKSRGVRSASS